MEELQTESRRMSDIIVFIVMLLGTVLIVVNTVANLMG
jgi:cell division protein FtsX